MSEPRTGGTLFSPRVRPAVRRAEPVARRAPDRPRRGCCSSRARGEKATPAPTSTLRPRIQPVGLNLYNPVFAAKGGIKELQAPAVAEDRVRHRRRRET